MKKLSSLFRSTAVVGGFTVLSRVLGLVREMLQARLIGAGVEQSAFVLAFAIPNMARKLFGEGALTAAFVPIFKGEVESGELESARRLAHAVMTGLFLALGALVALGMLGLTAWISFADALSPRMLLTLHLVRVLLPYMIFICGAAFGMGVLNALGRFAEGAFMPSLLNVIWIVTLGGLCFFPSLPLSTRIMWVSWAILVGGLCQMAFLFRCMARKGCAPRLSWHGLCDPKVKMVWRNTGWAALGAGAVQLNCALDQFLAQLASPWAAGVIGFAERLMDLPLGVVGVAFGTVLLPTFSGLFARQDVAGARDAFASSVRGMLFIMLPAAAGLFVLAPEITSVIYEGQAFDAYATVRVGRTLAAYAIGLGFCGLQKLLTPWFQAQGDMKTPLKVTGWTIVLNAMLNIFAVLCLSVEWRTVGLAASTSICAGVGSLLLLFLAHRRNGSLGLATIALPLARSFVAALTMAGALVVLKPYVCGLKTLVSLVVLIPAGALVYFAIAGFHLPTRRKI